MSGSAEAASRQSERGQASVEWMMLLLLALALLAISWTAIERARGAQTQAVTQRLARLQAEELAYYADHICVLGAGNAQMVELSPLAMGIRYEPGAHRVVVEREAVRETAAVRCPLHIDPSGPYASRAYLYYEEQDGQAGVRVSDRPASE